MASVGALSVTPAPHILPPSLIHKPTHTADQSLRPPALSLLLPPLPSIQSRNDFFLLLLFRYNFLSPPQSCLPSYSSSSFCTHTLSHAPNHTHTHACTFTHIAYSLSLFVFSYHFRRFYGT